MKNIAGRRLVPEMNFFTGSSTSEEATIGGEGEPLGLMVAHKIEENFRIPGVPYQKCLIEDVGESGTSMKKQAIAWINVVVWGRQCLDLCQPVLRGKPDFPNGDGTGFHGGESEKVAMSPNRGHDPSFRDAMGMYMRSGEDVVGGDEFDVGVIPIFVCSSNDLSIRRIRG